MTKFNIGGFTIKICIEIKTMTLEHSPKMSLSLWKFIAKPWIIHKANLTLKWVNYICIRETKTPVLCSYFVRIFSRNIPLKYPQFLKILWEVRWKFTGISVTEMGNIHQKKYILYTIYRYSQIFAQNIQYTYTLRVFEKYTIYNILLSQKVYSIYFQNIL